MSRIEARGIRCLECSGLDLQKFPEASKVGHGWCTLHAVPHYVAVAMARNCADFQPAPADVVAARDAWAARLPGLGQRK